MLPAVIPVETKIQCTAFTRAGSAGSRTHTMRQKLVEFSEALKFNIFQLAVCYKKRFSSYFFDRFQYGDPPDDDNADLNPKYTFYLIITIMYSQYLFWDCNPVPQLSVHKEKAHYVLFAIAGA